MALITCHECAQEISSEAASCPKCGAKPEKKNGFGVGGFVLVVIVGVLAYSCTRDSVTSVGKTASPKPVESQADRELNMGIAAARVLKQGAKDPSSFKVESFLIFPGGATCYEYRAKNSFGAIVPAQAVFTPPGSMVTSESDKRKFVKAWNEICTRSGGSERAGGLNLLNVF